MTNDERVQTVPCHQCLAEPGQPCRGVEAGHVHVGRLALMQSVEQATEASVRIGALMNRLETEKRRTADLTRAIAEAVRVLRAFDEEPASPPVAGDGDGEVVGRVSD